MSSVQTWVCVKQVKQDVAGEWNESMLLPGDIVEGFSDDYSTDGLFVPVKAKSELSSQLRKISRHTQDIWVKVRRGEDTLKLRACVVVYGRSKIQRKFTVRAASDDRHVAVLGDLTLEQCTELQGTFSCFSPLCATMAGRVWLKEKFFQNFFSLCYFYFLWS